MSLTVRVYAITQFVCVCVKRGRGGGGCVHTCSRACVLATRAWSCNHGAQPTCTLLLLPLLPLQARVKQLEGSLSDRDSAVIKYREQLLTVQQEATEAKARASAAAAEAAAAISEAAAARQTLDAHLARVEAAAASSTSNGPAAAAEEHTPTQSPPEP